MCDVPDYFQFALLIYDNGIIFENRYKLVSLVWC